jgi:two-component system, cell cycle sensor histidine kinase and response regulator CckA
VSDPETGRFLDANETAILNLGYSRKEILSLSVFDIDPTVNQSQYKSSIEELRKSGTLLYEGIHLRKDGSAFPVKVNIKYVQIDRDYIVTVVRDTTERKRAEEEIVMLAHTL